MSESKLKKVYRNICSIESILNASTLHNSTMAHQIKDLSTIFAEFKKSLNEVERNSYELIYANYFHDTIKHSDWFDEPLSLGAGAIGYNFAYILYRTIDAIKPTSILELGLGQSTKIIGSYAKHFKGVEHHVVEHDPEWIHFFERNYTISPATTIHLLENYKRTFNKTKLNAYKDFGKEFASQKFDLIAIDGPIGSKQEYSRMDIIELLPECLNKQFVIILDDCNRIGEQRTIKLIEEKLHKSNIGYRSSYHYKGMTDVYVCTSKDLEFLCHI